MKASDFIGKTIKKILIEERVGTTNAFLIFFEDDSSLLFHDEDPQIFFTPEGKDVERDIPTTPFTNFWKMMN